MVLVKIFEYFLLFFFVKIGPEKVFGKTVNKKLASKDYKNIDLRKSQNLHFCKGLVHGCGKKYEIYSSFPFC